MRPSKRAFDVVISAIGLLLILPALAAIAIAIRLNDGGPAFYRPMRLGRLGRPFRIWKFRTMVPNASSLGRPLTVGADPRVTSVGASLRRYKLDELPQLINVLIGDMSLVGPRPEAPELAARYTSEQREVLRVVPGITDPASISYANENELLAQSADPVAFYNSVVMPEKIRINLEYARRATLLSDLLVILRTVLHLVRIRTQR